MTSAVAKLSIERRIGASNKPILRTLSTGHYRRNAVHPPTAALGFINIATKVIIWGIHSGLYLNVVRAPLQYRSGNCFVLSLRRSVRVNPQAADAHQTRQTRPERRSSLIVRASSSATAASNSDAVPTANRWKVPTYIVLWYASNMIFNILNKSTLNAFPCPWFIATLQLVSSALFMVGLWVTGLQPVPKVPGKLWLALLPVGFFHTVGHVSACISFGQMAVSFAHIVKSAEPVLSVALSYPLLGLAYPYYVWLSLVPIVAGCSLSAMKEVTFAWSGFNNAMISNLGMVLRNILSKKLLSEGDNRLSGINLFGLISIVSLLFCAPAACALEAPAWQAAWSAASAQLGQREFLQLLAGSGLFYHLYNQLSYMVLDTGLSAVSLSVGNTMKRVFVVVSSVMFFRNPVSSMNWVGSAVAIFGTYLYSIATQKASDEKKKAATGNT